MSPYSLMGCSIVFGCTATFFSVAPHRMSFQFQQHTLFRLICFAFFVWTAPLGSSNAKRHGIMAAVSAAARETHSNASTPFRMLPSKSRAINNVATNNMSIIAGGKAISQCFHKRLQALLCHWHLTCASPIHLCVSLSHKLSDRSIRLSPHLRGRPRHSADDLHTPRKEALSSN